MSSARTFRAKFHSLLRHLQLLTVAMNLAFNRQGQLQRTLARMGFADIPDDGDDLRRVLIEASKEFGGVRTEMLLDAPTEVMKYHFGPDQVALSLLWALVVKYRELAKTHPTVFRDPRLDDFCDRNREFIADLKELRHSLLHERLENVRRQEEFTRKFSAGGFAGLETEFVNLFESYLRGLLKPEAE